MLRIFLKVSQMENTILRRMNLSSFLMVRTNLRNTPNIFTPIFLMLIIDIANVQLNYPLDYMLITENGPPVRSPIPPDVGLIVLAVPGSITLV